jgi:hypothetical protein
MVGPQYETESYSLKTDSILVCGKELYTPWVYTCLPSRTGLMLVGEKYSATSDSFDGVYFFKK